MRGRVSGSFSRQKDLKWSRNFDDYHEFRHRKQRSHPEFVHVWLTPRLTSWHRLSMWSCNEENRFLWTNKLGTIARDRDRNLKRRYFLPYYILRYETEYQTSIIVVSRQLHAIGSHSIMKQSDNDSLTVSFCTKVHLSNRKIHMRWYNVPCVPLDYYECLLLQLSSVPQLPVRCGGKIKPQTYFLTLLLSFYGLHSI